MRKIIALCADMHGGHKLGLCNPEAYTVNTALNPPKEERVNLNDWQEYIWGTYEQGIKKVKNLADGDPIIVNHLGDLTQGVKHPAQMMSPDITSHQKIAVYNLLPWYENGITTFRFITGTKAHVGEYFETPIVIAEALRAISDTIDVRVYHHLVQNIDGFLLDLAHHGSSGGIRSWTQGNQLRHELKSILLSSSEPPDAVVRAHFHTALQETVTQMVDGQPKQYHYILMPSLVGLSGHSRQVTRSINNVTNGIVALEFVGGKLIDTHWFTNVVDTRARETV